MPKSPEEMVDAMIKNYKEKTGKTFEQWLKIAKASKLAKHGELMKHLKADHGMTHGFANLVAMKHLKADAASIGTPTQLVDLQYKGDKAALKPIYDTLLATIRKFGKDVEVAPKKAYVSLRRNKQFAIIQPSTKTRIDVGLNLKGVKPAGKLEKAGSLGGMVSHRVRVETKKDVDAQLKKWLKDAYSAS
jgi:predicted transport protein